MREELVETAKEYRETQKRIDEVDQEIDELRQQTFGDGSKHTEEKARELFTEVSSTEGELSNTDKLDGLREEESELREQLAEYESDLLEELVNVRFPLDETIQGDEPPIEFPFSQSIDPAILDAISSALGEDISDGEVKIKTDAILVDTASINDAIKAVEREISEIRDRADANLNVPEQVQKVKDRDPKVAAILYVLYENNNEPMTKADMEDAIGLDRGDLRGQLYYVLDNDPYLEKGDEGFTLKSNGIKVIERFVDKYDVPGMIVNGEDTEEDAVPEKIGDETDEQEVTAHE